MSFSSPRANPPLASVVTCVEYGPLETMSIRMIESVRRWGGRLAHSPVFAVTPRAGMPLRKSTLAEFDRLGVTHLQLPTHQPYGWYNFLNKPLSLHAVQDRTNTDLMVWLDADILVLDEPSQFFLNPDEDFAACASDKNVGTTGPGDKWEPYWQELCRVLGIDIDSLPYVTSIRENQPIRMYWNGGVLVYRRATKYAHQYLADVIRLLDARFRLPDDGVFFHEQAACGLAMHRMGLKWRALDDDHNRPIGKRIQHLYSPQRITSAKLLHYHGSMWPDFWTDFVEYFRTTRPAMHQWLSTLPPVTYNPPLPRKIGQKIVASLRHRRRDSYLKTCRVVDVPGDKTNQKSDGGAKEAA